ncbi:MAG: amidohydrolase family protein [Chitinophagaceae bacterium]|nr:amidohydrolase family protein [Chitinophagaceae bacterium]
MYRKLTATHVFNGHRILEGDPVLITDNTGRIIELVDAGTAGDDIECLTGLLTPGFINAHCHLELSHMKNAIQPQTGLVEFVQQVIQKRESPEERKQECMRLAEEEMYRNGIVAVGDICNTADSLIVKQNSSLHWHNFIEITGFIGSVADKRIEQATQLQSRFREVLPGQPVTLSPHAPYSVSSRLFQGINDRTAGQLVTIHNQESIAENALYLDKTGDFLSLYNNLGIDISSFQPTGRSSFQSWVPHFTQEQSIISVHNTFTSPEDIFHCKSNLQPSPFNINFCLCPNANLYIENTLPPLDLLRENDVSIILGTDSFASNHQLDILEEIRIILNQTGGSVKLEEALQWATLNGAKALRFDDRLGSFEKGKTPGIVLIDSIENGTITDRSRARRVL